jgi:hypothetical protein
LDSAVRRCSTLHGRLIRADEGRRGNIPRIEILIENRWKDSCAGKDPAARGFFYNIFSPGPGSEI